MTDTPRILLFTGDGKGKTTAALGMALRACGHKMPVSMVQFIKNDPSTGELAAAAVLHDFEIMQSGRGFVPASTKPAFADHRAAAETGLKQAAERIASGRFGLVILDEVCGAVARGLLEERQVIEAVKSAPPQTCVVLTGRDATPGLIALADTVTEMRIVKHAMQAGRGAEKGVEW